MFVEEQAEACDAVCLCGPRQGQGIRRSFDHVADRFPIGTAQLWPANTILRVASVPNHSSKTSFKSLEPVFHLVTVEHRSGSRQIRAVVGCQRAHERFRDAFAVFVLDVHALSQG